VGCAHRRTYGLGPNFVVDVKNMNSVSTKKRVLLISNSTLYGSGYLDHAENEIREFPGNVGRVLFVPYALYDRNAYSSMARDRLKAMGYELDSIHTANDAKQAVNNAEAIFIGGGNTFRSFEVALRF
jgi:dipeptidase E